MHTTPTFDAIAMAKPRPFEEKLAMDKIVCCLSYSELALILAINMLTLLAVCIMTRRQCIKDGCMS